MEKLYYLLLIPVVRFLINLNHFFYLRKALRKIHEFKLAYIEDKVEDKNKDKEKIRKDKKAGNWVEENQLEIKKRVLNTGVPHQVKRFMDRAGYGFVTQKGISPLDNLLFMNKEIMGANYELLRSPKGHYKVQAWLSLSPLFWIELIVFLPREIVKMAGFDSEKKVSKNLLNIAQLIYWVVAIIYTIKLIK